MPLAILRSNDSPVPIYSFWWLAFCRPTDSKPSSSYLHFSYLLLLQIIFPFILSFPPSLLCHRIVFDRKYSRRCGVVLDLRHWSGWFAYINLLAIWHLPIFWAAGSGAAESAGSHYHWWWRFDEVWQRCSAPDRLAKRDCTVKKRGLKFNSTVRNFKDIWHYMFTCNDFSTPQWQKVCFNGW